MDKLKKFLDWFLKSSADPEKISATVKAIIAILGFIGLHKLDAVSSSDVATLISGVGIAISTIMGVSSLFRKIINTVRGIDGKPPVVGMMWFMK